MLAAQLGPQHSDVAGQVYSESNEQLEHKEQLVETEPISPVAGGILAKVKAHQVSLSGAI